MSKTINKKQKEEYQKYLELVATVNKHRTAIHLDSESPISEKELDFLKHQISIFEQNWPELQSPDSPNLQVAGGILPIFSKFVHKTRMLSLQDIFSEKELLDWENRWQDFAAKQQEMENPKISKTEKIENSEQAENPEKIEKYVLEPKIDGLAISLHYQRQENLEKNLENISNFENFVLVMAATRGDGFLGENVLEQIRFVADIPVFLSLNSEGFGQIFDKNEDVFLEIDKIESLEIRGEIFMKETDFQKLNQEIKMGQKIGRFGKTGPEFVFANPRNVASGTLRQLNLEILKERKLSFLAYNILFYGG